MLNYQHKVKLKDSSERLCEIKQLREREKSLKTLFCWLGTINPPTFNMETRLTTSISSKALLPFVA